VKSFFIATTTQDLHAAMVETALRHLGKPCLRWITTLHAKRETSVRFAPAPGPIWKDWDLDLGGGRLPRDLVFWNRRVAHDLAADSGLNEADRIVARREHRAFVDSALALLNTAAHRINDVYAAARAENKALQVAVARRCGLPVPETLITNSPDLIRDFLEAHRSEGVIAKPFSPTVWQSADEEFVGRAARLTPDLLPDDRVLRACPMIFQQYIAKAFEVRVTCFGRVLVGARLASQAHKSSQVDWRAVSPRRLNVEPIELPDQVRERCIGLLRTLGLEFGCIDMVVTPAGEWVFLEINQMGQFLWLEELNRDFPMLDLFVQLLDGTLEDRSVKPRYDLDFEAINRTARQILGEERKTGFPVEQGNRVYE
jgi:glutathione synthase/RimK-type ligase-like ATP-grasp enzyme